MEQPEPFNELESHTFVDEVLRTLPDLALRTKAEVMEHVKMARMASPEIQLQWNMLNQLQWNMLMAMIDLAKGILVDTEYQRLYDTIESTLKEIDAYMTQEEHEDPAGSLWSDEEAKLFGAKGA